MRPSCMERRNHATEQGAIQRTAFYVSSQAVTTCAFSLFYLSIYSFRCFPDLLRE
ncbi:hypothetical protein BU23DRAFT_327897 [Bimuria novae-zelandiae CBS 107.79]|uniref:Uncharacterized protein n=1 Tax=Bimuria novae-zelandiae CBS 107.79 TaxID=1447943 RepID=A0A6A5UN10_9PLEO|nr:hypothetical protein BU23DRAFT_327897 [Bimuria novae-zelandiae CBS 107.79]